MAEMSGKKIKITIYSSGEEHEVNVKQKCSKCGRDINLSEDRYDTNDFKTFGCELCFYK